MRARARVWAWSTQDLLALNDTHREKNVFYSIQYKNGWLVASDLFDMITQSVKFYSTSYYNVLRVQMFEKCDPSNRQ